MAVITGFVHDFQSGGQLTALVGRFYVNPFVPIGFNSEGFSTDGVFYGAPRTAPITGFAPRVPGKLIHGFFKPGVFDQFWLDRLHILPVSSVSIDLGNVVSDVDTVVEVFNASRDTNVNIATIDEDNADGFTILSGRLAPFLLAAYNGEIYTIRAESEEGPPNINATFTWIPTTQGFFAVAVNFIGNRITVFGFEPQVKPTTNYEWITAIIESYNGTEQRSSVREIPRMSIDYRLKKGGDDEAYGTQAQALEHAIFDSLGRTYAVPIWEDREVLLSPVGSPETEVNVNTLGRDFQVGELVLLWHSWDDFEAQEIASITSTVITATNPFVGTFAIADTVVLPTFLGFVDDGVRQQVFRKDYAVWATRFHRITNVNYQDGASPELPADFEGLPIWPRPWNIRGTSITRSWRRNTEQVAADVGKIERGFRLTVPRRASAELGVEIHGRTDFESFRQFLFALRGRQKTFWLPSFTSNFELRATATAGTALIRVSKNFYTTLVAERSPFDKIQVVLSDDRTFRHTIVASADIGGGEIDLSVTPAVGEPESPRPDYTLLNTVRIEYITKHRLNTDVLRFQGEQPRDDFSLVFPVIEVINE